MHNNKVITWTVDPVLDSIYETLRIKQYNKNHRLSNNYSKDHTIEVVAKSIYWGEDSVPKIVSSVLHRSCWPNNVFRILNRLWKTELNSGPTFNIDKGFGLMIENQIEWCLENGAPGMFMSRQSTSNWQSWAQPIFIQQTGIEFVAPPEKFLTCDNEANLDCWQHILYYGDLPLLNTWKRK